MCIHDPRIIGCGQAACQAALGEAADEGVRLVARYRPATRDRESAATGESMLAAHAVLRARIVFDRLRFGFADIITRPWARAPA